MRNIKSIALLSCILLVLPACVSPLLQATMDGNTKTVLDELNRGVNVNEKGNWGRTALMIAAERGDIEIVRALLNKKGDVNIEDNYEVTALALAASKGNNDILDLLLDHGANINAHDSRALQYALFNYHSTTAIKLLKRGSTIQNMPLHNAVSPEKESEEVVKYFLDKGADINSKDSMQYTALHFAAMLGNERVARLLVNRNIDINAKMVSGSTALHFAAQKGYINIVRMLLDKGADPGAIDSSGKTPLTLANEKGNTVIIRILMAAENKYYNVGKTSIDDSNNADKIGRSEPVPVKSDIDDPPTATVKGRNNLYAIVIGIEQYRQNLPKADFAKHDAQTVADYLTRTLGYSERNIITLLNDHAAKSDFEKYFEKWLLNNVEPGSTVFVYYSGHGAPNPKTSDAYLVPYDGDPSFIDETGYSLKRMYAALGKLPAKEIIVVLDSCFSGAGGRSVLAKGSRPLVMNIKNEVVMSKNMTVLSASSGEQTSSTYDEKGHGLFTYFMLKGIKNEDVIKPDGSLKLDDLFSYIKPQVERIARKQYNNEQTPQLIEPKKN